MAYSKGKHWMILLQRRLQLFQRAGEEGGGRGEGREGNIQTRLRENDDYDDPDAVGT